MDNLPVGTGGTFDAEVSSDEPVFYILKTVTGVAAKQALSPTDEEWPAGSITYMFDNDYLRPNKSFTCTGCHLGHMVEPGESFRARPNVARFAEASASSAENGFLNAPWRVKDMRMAAKPAKFLWVSGPGDLNPWVQLTWQEPLPVFGLHIYLPPAAWFPGTLGNFDEATITFSDGSTLPLDVPQDPPSYLDVTFDEKQISWLRIDTELPANAVAAISEIAVHGDHGYVLPDLPPDQPQGFGVVEEVMHLVWGWDTHGTTLGYRVHVRSESEPVGEVFDVGNVNHYQLRNLEPATRYLVSLEPYNVHGNSHGVITGEQEGTTSTLTIDGITPNEGPDYGETPVTVKGSGFSQWGMRVKIGEEWVRNVEYVDENTLTGVTYHQRSGIYDVVVSNLYDLSATLEDAFRHTRPGPFVDVMADKELYSMGETLRVERVLANDGTKDVATKAVMAIQVNEQDVYFYDGAEFKPEVTFFDWFLPAGFYEKSLFLEQELADPFIPGTYLLAIALFDEEVEEELAVGFCRFTVQ